MKLNRAFLLFWLKVLGLLLSTGLFVWLLARQDWTLVFQRLAGLNGWAIGLAFALFWGAYVFNTLRWCALLWAQGVELSYWKAFQIAWAGNFASNFLPSTIGGDGFRVLAVLPFAKSKTLALGSVVLDRLINMAAMTCLLPLPLSEFGLGALTGWAAFAPLGRLAEKYFPQMALAFRLWSTKPMGFVWAFLAAWPSNLLITAMTLVVSAQLGMQVSFWQVLAVQVIVYFVSVLPISFNGLGTRELMFTTFFMQLGASVEQASTLALLTRLIGTLGSLPGALWLTQSVLQTGAEDE